MRIVIGLCALALAACAQPTTKTGDAAGAAEEAAIAGTEGPAVEAALAVSSVPSGQYSAVSNTAMSITGDLTLGDVALTFVRGQSYRTERVGVIEASQAVAGGQSVASLFNVSATTGIEVRRVTAQEIGAAARNGSMCGRDTVTFVLLAAATGADNMPGLWIAAFKGAAQPGVGAGAAGDLCGTFSYAPAGF